MQPKALPKTLRKVKTFKNPDMQRCIEMKYQFNDGGSRNYSSAEKRLPRTENFYGGFVVCEILIIK